MYVNVVGSVASAVASSTVRPSGTVSSIRATPLPSTSTVTSRVSPGNAAGT
ncbi:hypothetical protein ACFQL4_26525 [Halosimplex aquaticum]